MNNFVLESLKGKEIVMTFECPMIQDLFKVAGLNVSYCPVPSQIIEIKDDVSITKVLEEAVVKNVYDVENLYASYGCTIDLVIGCLQYSVLDPNDKHYLQRLLTRFSGKSISIFTALACKMGEKIVKVCVETVVHIKEIAHIDKSVYDGNGLENVGLFEYWGIDERIIENIEGEIFHQNPFPLLNKQMEQLLYTHPIFEKSLFTLKY